MSKTHKTFERNRLTNISVSYENYLKLKKMGGAGDSFNDVLSELLKKVSQTGSQVRAWDQLATCDNEPKEVLTYD
jgi:flagellar hook-basal body complex protein FliE